MSTVTQLINLVRSETHIEYVIYAMRLLSNWSRQPIRTVVHVDGNDYWLMNFSLYVISRLGHDRCNWCSATVDFDEHEDISDV